VINSENGKARTMKFARKMSVGVVAFAVVALSACGSGQPVTSQGSASGGGVSPGGKVVIGFSISTMQNPYFVSMKQGIDQEASKEGVTVAFSDSNDDASKQANDVLNFTSQKVSVVVLNPVDSSAVAASVKALNQAGIPVLTVDRTADSGTVLAHIGTNNVTAGEIESTTLFKGMGGKGTIAVLDGVPGASPTIDRGTGIKNILKQTPGIQVVAEQTANFQRADGLTVTQNMLQAHPDIQAILSMNDEMALGAVQAIKQANLEGKIKVIGIDGGTDAIQAVDQGQMVATIAQQPALMGAQSIQQAVLVAKGQKIDPKQATAVIVIDSSNVKKYLP